MTELTKKGNIKHDGVLTLSKGFLDDWRTRINSMKDSKQKDYITAKYLLCLEMYKVAQKNLKVYAKR